MYDSEFKRLLKGIIQLADIKNWVVPTIPAAVGGILSYSMNKTFSPYWFVMTLVAVYFIEIGRNAVSEVVDYKTGVSKLIKPDKRTPFSGGKKVIIEGRLSVIEVILIAFVAIGSGCSIGIYVALTQALSALWVGAAGVLLAVFYSLPPIKLSYRGMGEIAAGIAYGPLLLLITYMIQTGGINAKILLVSIPIALLVISIVWINQYPDYEADMEAKKKTLLVRLGKEKGLVVYQLLFAAAFISIIIVSFVFQNPFWLLGLISAPTAAKAINAAKRYQDDVQLMVRANIMTVLVYQLTGLALVIGAYGKMFIR